MEVNDLNYMYSNIEDLRAEEELCIYPPRFKVSVNCLSVGKNLETEFKIILENDDVLDFDKVIKFPLIIAKSTTKVQPGNTACVYLLVFKTKILNLKRSRD